MTKKNQNPDPSTAEKIKNAARQLFHQKGFAATTTRDIAEEAGINPALLNYYFRSKKKLFNLIMMESITDFFNSLTSVFNNEKTNLDEKIVDIVDNYFALLIKRPDIPLFVLGELRSNPEVFVTKFNVKEKIVGSHFMQQLIDGILNDKIKPVNPLHIVMNIVSLTVFPFISGQVLNLPKGQLEALLMERKEFIPLWINDMFKIKQ